jgi:ABC-2 type transport system ATP-binding protein
VVDWAFVRQVAERLELDIKRAIKNLSKGNKQKVGVVQAVMHRPELIIMDEPTSGLDPLMQQEVHNLLKEMQAQGTTVFFSSHIMSEVETLAQRVGVIRQGQVVEVAETSTLVNRALRRVQVRFGEPVDAAALERVPGVTLLAAQDDGRGALLQVTGEMDALIKALAGFAVLDFETHRPSLEEIFLAYYEAQEA